MTRMRILSDLAASEVERDLTRTHDRLCAVLPALVVASARDEDCDGILTEPVRAVAEVVGTLEVAAGLSYGAPVWGPYYACARSYGPGTHGS